MFPNVLRSQLSANESATISNIREINKAQSVYQSTYPTRGFAASLSDLGPNQGKKCVVKNVGPEGMCLIGADLANALTPTTPFDGYWYRLNPTTRDSAGAVTGYVISAAPAVFNKTGVRDFCSTEEAVIHYKVPNANSEPPAPAQCAAMPVLQ